MPRPVFRTTHIDKQLYVAVKPRRRSDMAKHAEDYLQSQAASVRAPERKTSWKLPFTGNRTAGRT